MRSGVHHVRAWLAAGAAGTLLAALPACSTITFPATGPVPAAAAFSYDELNATLERFVDADGRVDYAGLQQDAAGLHRYLRRVAAHSPESDPALFPTEPDRLAYWINAYNAAALATVLAHYPIASVTDVRPPWLLFFLRRKSGFFAFQRLRYGHRALSLYRLENTIVRKRFSEPRVHFALNCASLGCPHLPRRAFTAEHLDAELDRETRTFVGEPRNVRIDDTGRSIWLSEIFDWYENDFVEWYRAQFPERTAGLIAYIGLYLPEPQAARLRRVAPAYRIRFTPYDWRLNDQRSTAAPP